MLIIRFEETTPLPLADAVAALRAEVQTTAGFVHKPFVGKISDEGFRIQEVPRRANTFTPILFGRFSPADRGTRVRVTMTMHPVVWIALIGWSCWSAYHWVYPNLHKLNDILSLGFPPLSLVIPWALALILFPFFARRSRALLMTYLNPAARPDGAV